MDKYTYSNYDMMAFKQEIDSRIDEIVSYLDNASKKCIDLSNSNNQLSIYKEKIISVREKIQNYKSQGYTTNGMSDPFNRLKSIERSYQNKERA